MKLKTKGKQPNKFMAGSVSVPTALREEYEEKKVVLLAAVKKLGVKGFSQLVRRVIISGELRENSSGEIELVVPLKAK